MHYQYHYYIIHISQREALRIAKVALDNASKISQADKGKKEKKVDKESRDVQVSKEIKKFFDKKVG